MKNKTLAAIIVYKPDSTLRKLVDDLILQNVDVFLFINEGNALTYKILYSKNVKYFISSENYWGLSKIWNSLKSKIDLVNSVNSL